MVCSAEPEQLWENGTEKECVVEELDEIRIEAGPRFAKPPLETVKRVDQDYFTQQPLPVIYHSNYKQRHLNRQVWSLTV